MIRKNNLKLESLNQIMNLQTTHFIELLFNLKPISFQYPFYWSNYFSFTTDLTVFALKKTFLWSTILLQLYNFLFPTAIVRIVESSLGINIHIDKLFGLAGLTNILLEHLSFTALHKLLTTTKYAPLTLCYDYSVSLDSTIDSNYSIKLIFWYTKTYSVAMWYLKFVKMFLFLCGFSFVFNSVKFFLEGLIDVPELTFHIYFSLADCYVSTFCLIFGAFIFVDLFFTVKIFKYKLRKAKKHLKMAPFVGKKRSAHQFTRQYMALHRELKMFNLFTSNFYFFWDVSFKIASSIFFAIFLLHTDTNFKSAYAQISISIVLFGAYFGMNASMLYLAYFPNQNFELYKMYYKMAFTARSWKNNHLNKKILKNMFLTNLNWSEMKHNLKVDSMIAFLSNNKMSFSYASFFPITNVCTVENIIANLYIIILICIRQARKQVK